MPKKNSSKSKIITRKQFRSWSPERRQRALRNKKVRYRIADNALPSSWLKKRRQSRFNKTEVAAGSGLTYGDLAKRRRYEEQLTFGEGERQLADRRRNLRDARRRDLNWFNQYRSDVAAAQGQAINAQNQMLQGNVQLINSANAVSASGRDAVVNQLQDRARQLGQVSQAGDYQALADQAASARAASIANTAQRQVSDANNQVNVMANAVGTARLKELEGRGFRDRQAQALDLDKKDYSSKKSAWREKFLDDAIAEARKQVLEDRVFQSNLQDKAFDNALNLRKQRSAERLARRKLQLDRQSEARLQAEANKSDGSSGGGGSRGGGNNRTVVQNRTAKSKVAKALSWAARLRKNGWSQSAIRAGLIQGAKLPKGQGTLPSFDKDVVNTALDISYRGYVGPVNYRIWKSGGYNVHSWGWKIKKKGR